MNKLNDSSFIDFSGKQPFSTNYTYLSTENVTRMWNLKQPKKLKDEKKRECGKSCLKGPPRELRISLKSSVSHKMQIRQICTENLGATLIQIKSSSFKIVFSSATRGCRGTIRNYVLLPRRWATRAQSCCSWTQQIPFYSYWQ